MTTGLVTAGMVGLSGCQGDESSDSVGNRAENDSDDSDADRNESDREEQQKGTLATYVSDRSGRSGDIGDFESCVVTVAGLWVRPADEPESNREYYAAESPQAVDLVDRQSGRTRLVDELDLPTGRYDGLELDVTSIDAALLEGDTATVSVPGDAPLAFTESFEIRAATETTFVVDVAPVRGDRADAYVLRPVADGTTVRYGDDDGSGSSETGDSDEPDESDTDSSPAGSYSADVVHAIGRVSSAGTIETVELVVKRSAGSDPIDLSQFRLEFVSDATDATLAHGGSGSETDSTSETFVTTTVAGDSPHNELVALADRTAITVDAALVRGDDGLPAGSSATLTLRTDAGTAFVYAADVPGTLGDSDAVLL